MSVHAAPRGSSRQDARGAEGHAGLRESKKQRTRAELAAAAFALVAQRGLAGCTVDEIAAAADVSPRTFFNYFSTKEEAVVAHTEAKRAFLLDVLTGRPAGEPPLDGLRAAMAEHTRRRAGEGVAQQRQLLRLVGREPGLLPHLLGSFAATESALAAWVAERSGTDPDADLYPHLLAGNCRAAVRTCLTWWERRPGGTADELADAIDVAFDQIARGLPPPR
jgi:AcrR family transcriptional regulator